MTTHTVIAQQITDKFIQIVFSGRSPVLIERPHGDEDSPAVQDYLNFQAMALDCLDSGNWENFFNCISPSANLSKLSKNKSLDMVDGTISYKGYTIRNGLTVRIVELCTESYKGGGKMTDNELLKLSRLLGKVMDNSSKRATDSLWSFLNNNRVNVLDNGNILLYGTLDEDGNLNGLEHDKKGVISKPRNMVNDVSVDNEMSLRASPSSNGTVGVYKVNPKHVVYVGSNSVSLCKMTQIDTFQGQ